MHIQKQGRSANFQLLYVGRTFGSKQALVFQSPAFVYAQRQQKFYKNYRLKRVKNNYKRFLSMNKFLYFYPNYKIKKNEKDI